MTGLTQQVPASGSFINPAMQLYQNIVEEHHSEPLREWFNRLRIPCQPNRVEKDYHTGYASRSGSVVSSADSVFPPSSVASSITGKSIKTAGSQHSSTYFSARYDSSKRLL
jgi:hypothetical protein